MCVGPLAPPKPPASVASSPAAAAPGPIPAQLVTAAPVGGSRDSARSALAGVIGTTSTSAQGLSSEATTAKKTLLGV